MICTPFNTVLNDKKRQPASFIHDDDDDDNIDHDDNNDNNDNEIWMCLYKLKCVDMYVLILVQNMQCMHFTVARSPRTSEVNVEHIRASSFWQMEYN